MKKLHLVIITFLIFYSFLFLGSRLLPFIDLPMHLASAKIYSNFGKSGNSFSTFYTLKPIIPNPNVLHLLFCSKFKNIELANKLFYLFYALLLPLMTLLFIKKLGGNIWFSLLSFIFLFNYSVGWGFTGYTIAIPLTLFFFYNLYAYIINPSISKSALLILLSVFLFFTHALAAMYSLSIFVITVIILNWKKPRRMIIDFACMIPLIVLLSIWLLGLDEEAIARGPFFSTVINYYSSAFWGDLWERITGLFYWDNYFLAHGFTGKIIGLAFTVSVILILLFGILKKVNKFTPNEKAIRFVLISLCLTAIWYFFLPHKHYFLYFYFRFSVYFFLLLIILASVLVPRLPLKLKSAIIFLVLIHLGLWGNYFWQFQKNNKAFTRDLFPDNKPHYRLAGLMFEPYFRGQPIYHHFPNYYILWKSGIAVTSITELLAGAIVDRNVDFDTLPHYNPWVGTDKYDGRFNNMELLLTRGAIPEKGRENFELYRMVKKKGKWRVFAKK